MWLSRCMIVFWLSIFTWATVNLLEAHMIAKQIMVVLLSVVFVLLYRNWRFGKCVVLATLFQSILLIADFITIMLKKSLMGSETGENQLENFVIIVISKLVLFLLVLAIENIFQQNDTEYIEEKEWILFSVLPIFTMN